jgi:AcrR family transcriptional regulator
MTRSVDLAHRADLLDRIAGYVVANGVADLSLRPLGAAVGLSPRTLLYHFGSKEAIVAAVLRHIREGQIKVLERLRRGDISTPGAVCRAAWDYMEAPNVAPTLKLFFETYALALRDPKRFPGFLEAAVEDWLGFLSEPLCAGGVPRERARTIATIVLAGYRGFMLDFVATNDGARIGRAIDAWLESLAVLYPPGDKHHAQQA